MNTHDIDIELPEHDCLYETTNESGFIDVEPAYRKSTVLRLIEADRQRRGEPDWDAIKGKRMCDLSASQQEDARELWLREQWRWFGEGESRPGGHIKFLLDRLDAVRVPQPAEPDRGEQRIDWLREVRECAEHVATSDYFGIDAAISKLMSVVERWPQPTEPVKLECPKCGADRSKVPCAGDS